MHQSPHWGWFMYVYVYVCFIFPSQFEDVWRQMPVTEQKKLHYRQFRKYFRAVGSADGPNNKILLPSPELKDADSAIKTHRPNTGSAILQRTKVRDVASEICQSICCVNLNIRIGNKWFKCALCLRIVKKCQYSCSILWLLPTTSSQQ